MAQGFTQSPLLHPVESLVLDAKKNFREMLETQSKSYSAARDEYRRRYSMDPPPGFEAWYKFAASHQSPIIDDFDTIYDSVSPFWRLSGKQVIRIMHDAQKALNSELWLCDFSGASAQSSCSHPRRTFDRHISFSFNKLLEDLPGALPSVKFLVNHLDEPVVIIPPPTSRPEEDQQNGTFELKDLSRTPIWYAITRFCTSQQSSDRRQAKHAVNTFGLPFVTDLATTMDLCQHAEYSGLHGLFMSPTSFRLIEGPVPVLSTGSPSAMGDILFPSPAYMESEFQYDESHDIGWDQKRENLYWAGSTTGGFALDEQWRSYHRQRFVTLVQNPDQQKRYRYLRETENTIECIELSFLDGRQFDVAFTRVFGCDRTHCRDQRTFFNLKSWADKDQAFKSQLVFDIDGNGISGRYYKLLASKSVPLKLTLLREWHDDRLVPWAHYIPVSQGMEELPELVRYLTSSESGRQRAREIADLGREWYSRALRHVDMSIYLYRLLLELARIQDPARQAVEV